MEIEVESLQKQQFLVPYCFLQSDPKIHNYLHIQLWPSVFIIIIIIFNIPNSAITNTWQ